MNPFPPRPLARASALALASLLPLLMLPYAAAHGGTPVEYKEGDITLGPRGTPGGLFHQFGFAMGPGDVIHIQYLVTSPSDESVDFSLHRHNATGYLEILNVTQPYLQMDRSVPDAGFYMPQWLNLIPSSLTLHYTIYYARGPSTLDLVEEVLAMGIPGGLLVLFACTYLRNRRREAVGSRGGPRGGESEAGEGAGSRGSP